MKIAIIGSAGQVGSALDEHFNKCGHSVLRVERDTELTLEDAARIADVVFIVILPIEDVAALFARAANTMRPGTLLIHGTSIENPLAPHNIDTELATKNGITACHCHFHFRPEIPLERTLFGQKVSISFTGPNQEPWKDWLGSIFIPFQPLLYYFKLGEHDYITTVSQLMHMIVAFMVGGSWQRYTSLIVSTGINIGGPPCQLLVRSIFRTASSGKIISEVLLNHPFALGLITSLSQSLRELKRAIIEKDRDTLITMLGAARKKVDADELETWDASTSQLIRLEADMRKTVATFHFSAEQNRTGLLAKVLHEFDIRNIDKTSTIAQVTPDGGCTIMIGVKENSPAVQEAEVEIKKWV